MSVSTAQALALRDLYGAVDQQLVNRFVERAQECERLEAAAVNELRPLAQWLEAKGMSKAFREAIKLLDQHLGAAAADALASAKEPATIDPE